MRGQESADLSSGYLAAKDEQGSELWPEAAPRKRNVSLKSSIFITNYYFYYK